MRDDIALETEATELLRTMIRNACVNRRPRLRPGDPQRRGAGGLLRGLGPLLRALRRGARTHEPHRAHRGQRPPRADAAPHGPHRRRAGQPGRLAPRPLRRRPRRRHRLGPRRHRHAEPHRDHGRGHASASRSRGFRPRGTLIYLAVADEEARRACGAEHLMRARRRRGQGRLRHHRERRRADPDAVRPRASASPSARRASTGAGSLVHGTPGHGSRPFRTDNALVTAAEVVQRLAAYQPKARILDVWRGYVEPLQLDPDADRGADRSRPRVRRRVRPGQPGAGPRGPRLHAHDVLAQHRPRRQKVNVIPDRVDIDVDIRSLPGIEPHEVEAMLEEALGDRRPPA